VLIIDQLLKEPFRDTASHLRAAGLERSDKLTNSAPRTGDAAGITLHQHGGTFARAVVVCSPRAVPVHHRQPVAPHGFLQPLDSFAVLAKEDPEIDHRNRLRFDQVRGRKASAAGICLTSGRCLGVTGVRRTRGRLQGRRCPELLPFQAGRWGRRPWPTGCGGAKLCKCGCGLFGGGL
jgi:hypothetical protein